MPDYAKWQEGSVSIDFKIETFVASAINDSAAEFAEFLKAEIPVRTGKLRNSVRIIPANKRAGRTQATVVVGATRETKDYVWEVWKGVEHGRGIFASEEKQWMVFSNWDKGPSRFRWKDGKFHFRAVNHPARRGDRFVERAIAGFRKTLPRIFHRKLKTMFEGKK